MAAKHREPDKERSEGVVRAATVRELREELIANCTDQLDDGVAAGGAALGWCAVLGLVVPRNRRAAWPLLLDAARKGSTDAAYLLALGHQEGWLGPPCGRTAARIYRRLADLGYAAAACHLGLMYSRGEGVRQSRALALKWYERAARLDDLVAAWNLVDLLRRGTLRDPQRARRIARSYARREHVGAATELAEMYERGEGGRANRAEAIRLYRLDSTRGSRPAERALRRLLKEEASAARTRRSSSTKEAPRRQSAPAPDPPLSWRAHTARRPSSRD